MTLRLGVMGVGGLLVVFGCAGHTASSGQEGPPDEAASEACVIDNDSLVLPSDGGCRLSAAQRADYGLQGADPACNGGRVEFGGLSGGRVSLNGLQIRCESGAELPDAPGEDTEEMVLDEPTPSGEADVAEAVTGLDPVPDDVPVGGLASAPPLLVTEWTRLEDDFSTGCDLVNGADFEAIIPTDGSGRLVVVSRLNQDVRDFVLPELILDEDLVVRAEPSGEVAARIRFKSGADGLRQLWLVRPDGRAWSLAEDAAGVSPRAVAGALCQACDLLGLDGSVLDGAFEPSGVTPEDLAEAACDPCTFLAGTRQCIPLP
jgi:hypothetical protein